MLYWTQEQKEEFSKRMKKINKKRCSTEEFKKRISQATSKRYENLEERKKHQKKISEVWSNKKIRKEQSDRLKKYYQEHGHDCSFNNIKCCLELNDNKIIFESIKDLYNFLKEKYNYRPDRRTFQKLLQQGKEGVPFNPFHKNKLKELIGMKIYKIDVVVETNCDECSGVGIEISTISKDEAQ